MTWVAMIRLRAWPYVWLTLVLMTWAVVGDKECLTDDWSRRP